MRHANLASVIGAVFVTALLLRPAGAAPPANELVAQVKAAYQEPAKYHDTVEITMKRVMGQQQQTRTAEATVAFDRESGRLLIEGPGSYVVVTDGTLQLKMEGITGHYMQTNVGDPLDFKKLAEKAPLIMEPLPAPDVAFLFADDPIAALAADGMMTGSSEQGAAEKRAKSVRSLDPAEEGEGPRLRMDVAIGTLTLTLDPETKLITKSMIEVSQQQMPGGADAEITAAYNHKVNTGKEAVTDEMFAFETGEREKVDTFMALIQAAQGQSRSPAQALEGEEAPTFELSRLDGGKFNMKNDASEVIVLDFWATWCGPCLQAFPKLQEAYEWAKKEHGDKVEFFAVNQSEDKQTVESFWSDQDYTFPVLMDTDGSVGDTYRARAIPQTVVIHNGTIETVHVGFSPRIAQSLKNEIGSLLEEDSEQENGE